VTPEGATELARRHNLRRVVGPDLVIVRWANGAVYRWRPPGSPPPGEWRSIPVVP
jgi:hypothetical protein